MGLLEITGKIDIKKFWPEGESDADTMKILIDSDGVKYASKVAHVFENAIVKGNNGEKSAIDNQGRIKVRLQGIDTPELHNSPNLPKEKKDITEEQKKELKKYNKPYRQYCAETATIRLVECLKETGLLDIPCTVKTFVTQPNEVFDTYGRFIGDIIVKIKEKEININRWLVEEGWAFPAFYTSMTEDEINILSKAAEKASNDRKGIWQFYSDEIRSSDEPLNYRELKRSDFDEKQDKGSVIFPKIFRRLCTWYACNKAEVITDDFLGYLRTYRDRCYLTEEFLSKGLNATQRYLDEFIINNKFTRKVEDLIFEENSSTLIGKDGKEVTGWR